MAWHLYIVPLIIIPGPGGREIRVPKYIYNLPVPNAISPFGSQMVCLAATDVDAATDTSIATNPDVTKIPDNLDNNVAVVATQNALENLNIPAGWINASQTYRFVLRAVLGMFAFFQRYRGLTGTTGPLLGGSVTLNTQFNQLPAGVRADLIATAADMGFDTSGLSGTNTIRQILKAMADQWGSREITLGGVTI